MNNTIPDNIDLDDENLDFSDETPISDSDDIPEMKVPILDDFITQTPVFGKFLGDKFNAIGFSLFKFMCISEMFKSPARQELKAKRDFMKEQIRAMAPHIVRFQRFHLWEKNKWGQQIRNQHNLIQYRNIDRHWKKINN